MSHTYKKNTEANAKVNDFNQKTMQALESLAFMKSAFEKAGYGEVSEEFHESMVEINVAQQAEEIAHEQLRKSRDRHDNDFLEMQEK